MQTSKKLRQQASFGYDKHSATVLSLVSDASQQDFASYHKRIGTFVKYVLRLNVCTHPKDGSRMKITQGRVLASRFFDIAENINLPLAEKFVSQLSRRPRFVGTAKHIDLPNPPLEMVLGGRGFQLAGFVVQDVMVRLYDVGAVVITFFLDLPNPTTPEELVTISKRIDESEDAITDSAKTVADEIKLAIANAMVPSEHILNIVEDYTIFYIQSTNPKCLGHELHEHIDIPRLLLAEPGPIAADERNSFVHTSFSYRPEDLVVVDWNSALVLDPTNAQDVPELLEFTMMQMLELRTYDAIVGRALDRVYKELDADQNRLFRSTKYQKVSRQIMQLFVDVVEITERIDNSLIFLGDSWLARLHRSSVAEFGMAHWQKQLRNKLEVLRQINELLVDQITSQNTMLLEIAVVVLILIEILIPLSKVLG